MRPEYPRKLPDCCRTTAGCLGPQKGDEVHRSKNGPLFNYFVGGGNKRLRDNDIEQTCCLGG